MIINSLDLGGKHPYPTPIVGQTVGLQIIEGYEQSIWPRGSVPRKQTVRFWIRAWQAIGGQSADTAGALKYLLKQVEELAGSRDQQPVYIQWTATAQPSQINTTDSHDGWYVIDDFEPTYQGVDFPLPMADCKMTVTHIAAAAPRRLALAYSGGALASNYSGTATNLVELPYGSTALELSFNRTHATTIAPPSVLSPVANPESFVAPATLANLFATDVRVYDTINTGTNPIPTTGGTYVNVNWVQVFGTDHDFVGDCVITNGLLLLQFGASTAINGYVWNTALATANWQNWGNVYAYDQSGNGGVIRAYSLVRVGGEEVAVAVIWNTAAGQVQKTVLRLQRGRYEARLDLTPLTQTETTNLYLNIAGTNGNNRITYNPSHVGDAALGEGALAVDSQYGYGAHFIPSTSFPIIFGYLYQNQPGANQPNAFANSSLTLGDTVALAVNAQRSYGFFAIPYGISGAYSTANLQQQMSTVTFSGGFVSAADAGASAANVAKLPSGTAVGAIALGPGAPYAAGAAGVYDLWARMRVTSNAAGTAQLRIGWYDGTSAAYVASSDFSPSNFTTSYAWYRVLTGMTLSSSAHSQEFRVISVTNAATTDFWLDELALVPKTLTDDKRGPQELWQQFMYDRSTRWVRP